MKQMQPVRANLSDIAVEARVSIATVSRVFADKNHVSQTTRLRVLQAARKLGFSARVNNLIALIVPDASNPFFAQLGFVFEQTLERQNYHLLASSSEGRPDRELQLIENFRSMGVKGLIYIASGQCSDALLSLVADGGFPVVVLDRRVQARNLDFVAVDSRKGTLGAVDYLVANGHERIAYLKGLVGTDTARERFDSFCEAMATNGRPVREEWIFEGDFSLVAGRTCAEHLIARSREWSRFQRPTALLAANDLMAIGLMQRLQQEGWHIPEDLSVIGFDNILWSEWTHPALTTISQPIPTLVRTAIDLLMDRLRESRKGDDSFVEGASCRVIPPRIRVLEPLLIPRSSVSPCCDILTNSPQRKLLQMSGGLSRGAEVQEEPNV